MNKKVLILGAKGNLGRQLAKVFEDRDIIALDKEDVDFLNERIVIKKINEIKPGVIINAVAYNAVDKCEEDDSQYELAKKINSDAVGCLVKASLENNAVLVHYSSDYVFSGNEKDGYQEKDVTSPINKYGETKLMGEKEILKFKDQGLKYYIIRTSKLFGPRGESEVSKPSFFDIMLNLSKERDEIDVVDEEVSCFTYTPDLAKATRSLVDNKSEHGIYHIINSGPCTWYEAARELFNIAGVDIKVNAVTSDKFPRPARRPKHSVLLNTKLDSLRDWREALKEYLKKFRY